MTLTMQWTSDRMNELINVNQDVNDNVEYVTDQEQYHVADYWANASITGKGDCEDYAIAKMAKLRVLGWAKECLNIAIVMLNGEGHAVLVANTSVTDYILDNNTDEVKEWRDYHPDKWVMISVDGDWKNWREITA